MERFRDLTVSITGGAGFIGSHLAEKLLGLGAEVTVIDNFIQGSKIEHLREHKRLSIYDGDVRDGEVISQGLKGKDMIFHLAAVVGVEETQMTPLEVLSIEIEGTLNVLRLAANSGVKRIILASSSEVYGDSPEPMKEEGPLSPKSTYAIAKLVAEEYCRAFYQRHGVEYVCLRYFNVYGPRQDERFVIPSLVRRALLDGIMPIYGDGRQTRDFTYVDDAVNMTLLAAVKPEVRCQTINIGTGITATINDLTSIVRRVLDSRRDVKDMYIDYDDKRPREIEVFRRLADITKAKKYLQYEPGISLESGVKKYADWWLGR
jgi:UDP-glucose 4-epimerase